jgi:hypothetical protein
VPEQQFDSIDHILRNKLLGPVVSMKAVSYNQLSFSLEIVTPFFFAKAYDWSQNRNKGRTKFAMDSEITARVPGTCKAKCTLHFRQHFSVFIQKHIFGCGYGAFSL